MRWRGVIAVEGVLSIDRRLVRPGALTWTVPVPLLHAAGEDGHRLVGRADSIWRIEGEDGRTVVMATGVLDEEPEDVGLSIATDGVEGGVEYGDGGALMFTAARIRQVWVGSVPIWPECVLGTIPGDPNPD